MTRVWSFVLQWSRVGINAALFLIATRYLTLVEIGTFATAFAPIRMTQGLHKAGIAEGTIIIGTTQRRQDALFALSLSAGLGLSALLTIVALTLGNPMLLALALIPVWNGIGAVPEGLLRQHLRLRALALRTMASQSIAAGLALWTLTQGMGAWALIIFALANAGLTCVLSVWQAHWRPANWPAWRYLRLILPKTSQIAGRDILNAALIPLVQLAVGAALGLAAAGAFQIATRMLGLIDALTLSPLRFIALPQLRQAQGTAMRPALAEHLRLSALLSVWIWGGTLIAAPQILTLLTGASHAAATAPILMALAGFGLISALAMPVNQALTARGHTPLMLVRAVVLLVVGLAFTIPALWISVTATGIALSLAALVTTLWHLARALPRLGLAPQDLAPALLPLAAGALMIAAMAALPPMPLIATIPLGTAIYAAVFVRLPRRRLA